MRQKTVTQLAMIGLLTGSNVLFANDFNIDVRNTDIAIEANNASLTELLAEMERLTGIPVEFTEDSDERVSLSVGMTTFENAVAKITPNHMILHEIQNGKKVIKELIVIPADSGGGDASVDTAFLPSGQPAPAIEPAVVESNVTADRPIAVVPAVSRAQPGLPEPQPSGQNLQPAIQNTNN